MIRRKSQFAVSANPVSKSVMIAAMAACTLAMASEPLWKPVIEVASGNAHRGPWRQNNSKYDFMDDAAVAINRQGFVAVAWADHARHDIFLRLYDPAGKAVFEEAVNISRSPGIFSWIPKLAISEGETPDEIAIHAIWQDIVFRGGGHGGEIFFATSRNGGRDFGKPMNLSDVIEGSGKGRSDRERWSNGSYCLFVCPKGIIHTAWTEYEGRLWYDRSDDGGRTFAGKSRVAGGPVGESGILPARGPALAADGDGAVFLAHTVGDVLDADIHLLVSRDGGRSFAEPIKVRPSPGYADAPSIALDSQGILHLVYAECDGGADGRPQLMHARLAKGGTTFGEPRTLFDTDHLAGGFPILKIDCRDRLLVAWEHYPAFPRRPRGIRLSSSEDGGSTFAAPILVPGLGGPQAEGFNGSQQGLLGAKFSAAPSGRIAFANSLFRQQEFSRILLAHGELPTD